ncbi:MAG: peptidylprolyl isomerase [Pseudomonadota bacterium]
MLGSIFAVAPAVAQPVGERVAAVVNDYPISTFDVRQRMRLMMITQGIGELPEEAIPQFQQQAMRDLIEERLKLQEAERWELEIPDDAIDEEIALIAASGGGGIESLTRDLALQGVDISTLREKVRADQAWEQLVRGRYGSRISVTDDEVKDMMDEMLATATEDQYLISEICLPVSAPSEQEQMYNIGMQMIDQMRQGAPFRALAQQYSACPSAARGGDLGWLKASDLDPDLAAVVTRLGAGNVSRPVPQQGMLKMLAVRQTRAAAAAGEPGYAVVYAGAPATMDADVVEAALDRLPRTNACNGENLSTDLGPGIGVAALPMLRQSEFETVFHDVLAGLEEGDMSEIIVSEGVYHRIILCEKDAGYGLPPRRSVENRLRAEELDLISRRYLRDVERDSAVEIRLGQQQEASES